MLGGQKLDYRSTREPWKMTLQVHGTTHLACRWKHQLELELDDGHAPDTTKMLVKELFWTATKSQAFKAPYPLSIYEA